MIKKLIASFLITSFVTNTAYAEKIMFDSYGCPIKTQTTTQNDLTPETFVVEEKTTKKQVVQNTNLEENMIPINVIEKMVDGKNFVDLNYKASTFNMDLSQALYAYHGVKAENEPLMIRAYNLQRKAGINEDLNLSKAPTRPESYFVALEKGIIPKYFSPYHQVCDNEAVINLIVEAYDLLLKNNFSEKDIKNFMYFYSNKYFKDTNPISITEIESIINDKYIAKKDRFYYIYAKMTARHYNNNKIESDVIKSLELIRQNPQIAKNKFYQTVLDDNILIILNYGSEYCITEETIRKVLEIKNISDGEKFFRILGKIHKKMLKAEKENYPEILYEIAETGILSRFFHDKEAYEYYKDEKVLQDVLTASKLLMKNKVWEWSYDRKEDIFTIAPELCITTKIVQEVLNDKKIPMKDKEEIMTRRLFKEKYLAYNEKRKNNGFSYNLISDEGFSLIEKGYFPKFVDEYSLKNEHKTKVYNKFIDLLKNKGLNETHIKTIIKSIDTPKEEWTENISQIDDPNEILKQLILADKNFYSGSENAIIKLFETGLINIDNINTKEIRYWDFKKISNEDIKTLVKLRHNNGFTEFDVQNYINNNVRYIPYLSKALEIVLNDPNIKIENRAIFTYALAKREEYKAQYPDASDAWRELIDKGINSDILCPNDKYCDNRNILDLYNYMHNELGYDLKQCEIIIKYIDKSDSNYAVKYKKTLKIVKNEKLDFEQKIEKLENAEKTARLRTDGKKSLKDFAGKALLVITAPIWIIPAAIIMLLFACSDNGTGTWN